MKDVLSEIEKTEIKKLVNNEILMNALSKILLRDIYSYGTLEQNTDPDPTRNFALSFLYDPASGMEYRINNEELGAKLRAALEGIRLVQASFNKLKSYNQETVEPKNEQNPAR